MRIEKLSLQQIAVFEDNVIEFPPCPEKDKAEIHIFTGQNGSGKSTILYALASAFKHFGDYMKKPNAAFYMFSHEDDYTFTGYINTITDIRSLLSKRFKKEGSNLNIQLDKLGIQIIQNQNGGLHKKIEDKQKFFGEGYGQFEAITERKESVSNKIEFKFAAFSYSSYRLVKSESITFISQDKINPAYTALDFFKEENTEYSLNQWIANNISKRDIAFQQKNETAARRYQQNLQQIETVISEIIGYKITFSLQLEPLNLVIKTQDAELDFDVLPDGLRSLISWIGDLLMRMDLLKWENDLPISERKFFLFLDEIEVHLHPAWQRKVLPIVQKLFKNAQIFISTHSPFVVNSINGAWIHEIELENGKAKINAPVLSNAGYSYSHVLSEFFDIEKNFGEIVENDLAIFYTKRHEILASPNGISAHLKKDFLKIAQKLSEQSTALNTIIQMEIRQINRLKATDFVI